MWLDSTTMRLSPMLLSLGLIFFSPKKLKPGFTYPQRITMNAHRIVLGAGSSAFRRYFEVATSLFPPELLDARA